MDDYYTLMFVEGKLRKSSTEGPVGWAGSQQSFGVITLMIGLDLPAATHRAEGRTRLLRLLVRTQDRSMLGIESSAIQKLLLKWHEREERAKERYKEKKIRNY
jgi:hypothetical protein